MSLSNTTENAALKMFLQGTDPTYRAGATQFLALFSADPGETASLAAEATYTGYARVALTKASAWTDNGAAYDGDWWAVAGRRGTAGAAFEALRRDKYSRALLDLSAWSWLSVIKTLLGHPNPAYAATSLGKGLLLRLVIGENLSMLLLDDDLVLTISVAAPSLRWRDGLA